MSTPEKPRLKRVLNRKDLLALAWGCMVGWGWVVLSGDMALSAGTLGSAFAFLFAGVIISLVGLVYGDLTSRIPRAGGELAFCFVGLGPKRSAACGWILCLNPSPERGSILNQYPGVMYANVRPTGTTALPLAGILTLSTACKSDPESPVSGHTLLI